MSAVLDSEASFFERVVDMGLGAFQDKFKALNWVSHGTFAFATDYVPGSGNMVAFNDDIVIPALGLATHPKKLLLRRLFFESYTLAASDLRRRAQASADDAPVAVPNAEKQARWKRLRSSLTGLTLEGELEPSYQLVDHFNDCWDKNQLVIPSWDFCTKRGQELAHVKRDLYWKMAMDPATGFMKASAQAEPQTAEWKDLLQLRYLLQRMGLAMDLANLMSFAKHEAILNWLFTRLAREAPAGYRAPSLDQFHMAWTRIFQDLAKETRDGVRPLLDGSRPLESAVAGRLQDPDIALLMQPLPLAVSASRAPSAGSGNRDLDTAAEHTQPTKRANKDKRVIKALKKEKDKLVKQSRAAKGGGKGDGKGGAQGKGRDAQRMPSPLIGKSGRTANNEPICFAYNISGCSLAQPGQKCIKGMHVCAEPGCGKSHSLTEHKH